MQLRKFGWILKDESKRRSFSKAELKKKILKGLLYSVEFPSNYKMYFERKFHSFSKYSAKSSYRSYGMFSYIGKSVFRRFKLNRHCIKSKASAGFIVGLRKSSF